MAEKTTNLRVKESELRTLQLAAIQIGSKTQVHKKWQDIVRYMIENYTDDAVKDMCSKK